MSANTSSGPTFETAVAGPAARKNPFVGPRAFTANERLYGRDRELRKLLNLLIAERIVLFYSPSGAGKTSLIQAGLIPALEAEQFQVLPVMRVNREPQPDTVQGIAIRNRYTLSLLLSLEEALPQDRHLPMEKLAGMSLEEYLQRRHKFTGSLDEQVLVFDQFEEILTADPMNRPAKEAFFQEVADTLRDRRYWALFAIREDYLAALDPYRAMVPTQLSTTLRLDLLEETAARLVIRNTAHQEGVDFTEASSTKLADDLRQVRIQRPDGTAEEQLGPYVEPMQLQVVCHSIWDKLAPDARQIVEADVEAIGDVDTALAGYYAERVKAIAGTTGVRERRIRDWFDTQLITHQGIRGQVLQEPTETQGLDNSAAWALVDAHLVRAEQRRGATWFELAHDRLIEPVQRDNARWREAHLSILQRSAAIWDEKDHATGLLIRGQVLEQAEGWAARHPEDLLPSEREFLRASHTNQRVRIQLRLAVLAVLAAVSILAAVAVYEWYYVNNLKQEARAQALAAQAATQVRNPELGVLLARESVSPTLPLCKLPKCQIVSSLHLAVARSQIRLTLGGQSGQNASKGIVWHAEFSPDGKSIVSAGDDTAPKIWNAQTGQLRSTLQGPNGHKCAVDWASYSPDLDGDGPDPGGRFIATASKDKTVKVWDTASEQVQVLFTLEGHTEGVWAAVFSPDGKTIATASDDNTAKVWDAQTGKELHSLEGHEDVVLSVAYSPDGKRIVTASADGTAKVWDEIGTKPLSLEGHKDRVISAAFSPDGLRIVTASDDHKAKVWDAQTEEMLFTLRGHIDTVTSAVFSPDGKYILTSGHDWTAKIWDSQTGWLITTLYGHTDRVRSAAYSPDGLFIVTAGDDSTVRVWSATEQELPSMSGHTDETWSVEYSPDGLNLVTASFDHTARVWDTKTGKQLHLLGDLKYGKHMNSATYSPDPDGPGPEPQRKFILTASDDGTARVWVTKTGQLKFILVDPELPDHEDPALPAIKSHTGAVSYAVYSPDGGSIVTVSEDKTAKVWNAQNGTLLHTLIGHTKPLWGAVFSSDGKYIVTVGEDYIPRVWESKTGKLERPLTGHTLGMANAEFSPDPDGPGPDPGGHFIATASVDGTAKIWDAKSGKELHTLRGHGDKIHTSQYSPDGRFIVTASKDRTAKVWDAQEGVELFTLSGHSGDVYLAVFSPDPDGPLGPDPGGHFILTASADGTAKVWNAQTGQELSGQELYTLVGQTGEVLSASFSRDGSRIVTIGSDGTARQYLTNLEDLRALAATHVTRDFTAVERNIYLGDSLPIPTPTPLSSPTPAPCP